MEEESHLVGGRESIGPYFDKLRTVLSSSEVMGVSRCKAFKEVKPGHVQ